MSRSHPVASAAALARFVSIGIIFIGFVSAGFAVETLVNINTASVAVLAQRLPGIGPVKARAIVVHRENHGLFNSAEDLLDVRGIGPVTLAKIRLFLHVETVSGGVGTGAAASGTASGGALTEQQKEQAARALVRSVVRRAINAGSP